MGQQKLFLPLRGKPVLQWVLESVLASGIDEVVCVVRDLRSICGKIAVSQERLIWLVNEATDRGQSTSVIAGLWAVDPRSEGALFLVGDQPLVQSALIDALIERFKSSAARIVAPSFRGQTRNPVIFRRDLFPELLKLTGDRGGRGVIDKYREQTALLEWHDEATFLDLDVHEDYEKLKQFD